MGFAPHVLGAQTFYSYPQTLFPPVGLYSLRFIHTAFLMEDDLDRLFYPVHIYDIKGARLFAILSTESSPMDSFTLANNDVVIGFKSNKFMNLSSLYSSRGWGYENMYSSDTLYSISAYLRGGGGGPDSAYIMDVYVKDSIYEGFRSFSNGFLVSMGNQVFGILFLYANISRRYFPLGDTSSKAGNFFYIYRITDRIGDSVLRESKLSSYEVSDSIYRPILGGISFRIKERFSVLLFGGVIKNNLKDSSLYAYENDTADANRFVGEKVYNSGYSYDKSSPWFIGFQGDYTFGSEKSRYNVMLSYVFKSYSKGQGYNSYSAYHGWWDSMPSPYFLQTDTSLEKYVYKGSSHEFNVYLRGIYSLSEKISLGVGLGFRILSRNLRFDTVNATTKSITFRDANGNGSVDDPADFKTTLYTSMTYTKNVKTGVFTYAIPLGFEITPVEGWPGFKIRGGTIISGVKTTTDIKTSNYSVESVRIEESGSPDTTITLPKDLPLPQQYSSISKTTLSPYPLYYGVSWKVSDRLILDITGMGYGFIFPRIWSIGITLMF